MSIDSTKDTLKHINEVKSLIKRVRDELENRAQNHDNSKLEEPEKSIFDIYTPKLKTTTYGSDEYQQCLKEMQVALDHHYACNPHHPEFHNNGINDMSIIDLIEMLCDWMAATKRHDDGDIRRSVELN